MKSKKTLKKLICTYLSIIMTLYVLSYTNLTAYSAYGDPVNGVIVKQSDYSHPIANVDGAVGVGGLSVCDNSNKLYVLKAEKEDNESVLYYYENAYDMNSFAAKIEFNDGLLGHANGMAIDDDFLYVTMWKHSSKESNAEVNNEYNNSIMRISRSAIHKIANYYIKNYKKLSNVPADKLIEVKKGNEYSNNKYYITIGDSSQLTFICRSFVPIRSDNNQPYT